MNDVGTETPILLARRRVASDGHAQAFGVFYVGTG
jgi:hypothetical protein